MLSIETFLKQLFPNGTRPEDGGRSWSKCPKFPTDVFAAAASLMEHTGAYKYIRLFGTPFESRPNSDHCISFSEEDWGEIIKVADEWRSGDPADSYSPYLPPEAEQKWKRLWKNRKLPICNDAEEIETWWEDFAFLFFAADQAFAKDELGKPESSWIDMAIFALLSTGSTELGSEGEFGVYSYAFAASPDVLCVLPKSVGVSVGYTLRSLSTHLALLPPRSVVRCRHQPIIGQNGKDESPFNLLLVPFPYSVSSICFQPVGDENDNDYGWFDVDQNWLPSSNDRKDGRRVDKKFRGPPFAEFIAELIAAASRDMKKIDGVVLPELALDWDCYFHVRQELEKYPEIEVFVSGLSERPIDPKDAASEVVPGNYVACTIYVDGNESEDRQTVTSIREKHHPWKLDEFQIKRYAIASSLDPQKDWWEHIDITDRTIDLYEFRKNSTMTTLICEDLARIDPCQQALRSIGPNLVIALLMDGPQLMKRWSGRYATVLADDPGSSVLSISSMGLIRRQNHNEPQYSSTSFALWKEGTGATKEISLPQGAHAVTITLSAIRESRSSSTKRMTNSNSLTWSFSGSHPVFLPNAARHKWLT